MRKHVENTISRSELIDAYIFVCASRKRWPANADIWHLRFHHKQRLPDILKQVNSNNWRLTPLQVVRNSAGEERAIWSAEDALVLKALSAILSRILPVSRHCTHVRGNGGGKRELYALHARLRDGAYQYVYRTDIRGYYRNIDKELLFRQLQKYITSPVLLNLLWQFLHYSVEKGGMFHTPVKGIPRASSLSPLLAAFHLYETDKSFGSRKEVFYTRYMDDFLIFTRTRWQLRRAVKQLRHEFNNYGFEPHPDKTFTGRISKGFDWLGFWFKESGCVSVAPRAVNNFMTKLCRLYERSRNQPALRQAGRVVRYVIAWCAWASCFAIGSDQSFIHQSRSSTRISFYKILTPSGRWG